MRTTKCEPLVEILLKPKGIATKKQKGLQPVKIKKCYKKLIYLKDEILQITYKLFSTLVFIKILIKSETNVYVKT